MYAAAMHGPSHSLRASECRRLAPGSLPLRLAETEVALGRGALLPAAAMRPRGRRSLPAARHAGASAPSNATPPLAGVGGHGLLVGGAGMETVLLDKACLLRATCASIGDDMDARMPLACAAAQFGAILGAIRRAIL